MLQLAGVSRLRQMAGRTSGMRNRCGIKAIDLVHELKGVFKNVYTNVYLLDETEDVIQMIINLAEDLRAGHKLLAEAIPHEESELVIDCPTPGQWRYYFANSSLKTVYWVHQMPLLSISKSCFTQSDSHLGQPVTIRHFSHP